MDPLGGPRLRLGPLLAAAVGLLALFWHPGPFSNDDVGQAAGLYFLSHGSLAVTNDLPPGFDAHLQGAFRHFSIPERDGVEAPPFDSTLLNVLALPPLFLLKGLEAVLGYHGAVGLVQAAVVGGGLWGALALLGKPWHTRLRWSGLLAAGLALGSFAREPSGVPAEPLLEFAALQAVNMAAMAVAAVLMFDLLRRRMPEPSALAAAGLFLVATPAFFWGLGAKDHGLAIAAVPVALWCYRDGHRSDLLHTFAAFAVCGLLVWHHFRLGVFLLATLGLLALPAVRLGVAGLAARAAAGALGLLPGLALDGWQRLLHQGLRLRGDWGDFGTPVPGAEGPAGTFGLNVPDQVKYGRLSHSVLADPEGVLYTLRQTWAWSDWMELGAALSFLCIFPLLAACAVTLSRKPLRRGLPLPVLVACVAYPVLYFGVAGRYLLRQGYGFDVRYAASLWPLLVLLAAPALDALWRSMGLRRFLERATAVGVPFLALTLALVLVLRALYGTFTPQGNLFDETLFMRYGGLAVGVALVGVWPLAARWPQAGTALGWLAPAAAGLAAQFQLFLQLALARTDETGPMVAWPLELPYQGALWMIYP